jgi:hypothetical protein
MAKNKNIHKLDNESVVSLKNMIFSTDSTAVEMGMVILKHADLNDEETVKQLNNFTQNNIMDLHEMDADVMKEMLAVFSSLQERGLIVENQKQTIIESKDDTDVVKELSIFNAAIIEREFIARKKLAEEWLQDGTTDERKYELERQIHDINKKVADILGIEYSDEE